MADESAAVDHRGALQRGTGQPLWSQLLDHLRARLAAGEFAEGFLPELAVVEQYGVSRATVREALKRLRSEGVVTAARGRRPQAVDVEVQQQLSTLGSLFVTVEAQGLTQRSLVRRLETTTHAEAARRLGLEPGAGLVHLERLRLADDRPLALDRVWLPAAVAAPLLDLDFGHTSLYGELARACGVTVAGGSEQVSAVVPSAAERRLLEVDARVALLSLVRVGLHLGRPVEYRHTLVRADRYALFADLGPSASMSWRSSP